MASVAELMLLFKADASGVSGATDQIDGKLKGLAKTAAGAMAGFATGKAAQELVGLGVAFDDVYDGMAIKTGATGAELEALQQSFRNVAGTVPVDFETAGAAVETVSVRLGATGETLDALSVQFANLSRITGTDVTANVNAAADVFNKLTLGSDEQADAMDRIFAASQQAGMSFEEMAQQIGDAAPQIDMLGMGVNTASGLFATLGKAGIDAGATMKAVTMFAKDQSEAFKEHGKAMDASANANQKVEKAQANLDKVMQNAKSTPEQVAAAQAKLTEAQDKAAEATMALEASELKLEAAKGPMMDSLSATIEKMKELGPGAAQNALAFETFGAKAGPQFVQALNAGTLSVEDFKAGLQGAGPGINDTAASTDDMQQKFDLLKNKVMLAAEGFAPLGMALQPVVGMLPMLGGALGTMAPMLMSVGTAALGAVPGIIAFLAPFLPIILAIGAVIAIGVLLYKNWDEIKAKAAELGAMLSAKFDEIKASISERVEAIRAWVQEKWDAMCAAVTAALEGLRVSVSQGWDRIKEYVAAKAEEIRSAVAEKWEAVVTAVNGAVERAREIIDTVMRKWQKIVGDAMGVVYDLVARVFGENSGIAVLVRTASDAITGILGALRQFLVGDFSQAWSTLQETVLGVWAGLREAVRTSVDNVVTKAKELIGIFFGPDGFVTKLTGIDLVEVGENIINGLKDGIDRGLEPLRALMRLFAEMLPQVVKDALGMHSPSKVFRQIGQDIGAGLVEGLKASQRAVVNATQFLVASVVRAAEGAAPELKIGGEAGETGGLARTLVSLMEHIMGAGWGSGGLGGNALAAWMRTMGFDEETVGNYKDLHSMREGGHWKTREAFMLWKRRVMPRGGDWTGAGAAESSQINARPIGPYGGYDDLYVQRPSMGTAYDPNAIVKVELKKGTELHGTLETWNPVMIVFKIGDREISAITEQVMRRMGGSLVVSPSPGTP